MTITLPLHPADEAKLHALARAKGTTTEALLRSAIDTLLGEYPTTTPAKEPTRSLRGLLANHGPAPSSEDIDQNRAEMFADFPRSDY